MTQEQIGGTRLQSREGKQLESSGGQHILNGIFLLQEVGMGPQSRDLTLFPSPFEQERHGPIDPKCYISISATALPHSHGHGPFHFHPSPVLLAWSGFGINPSHSSGFGCECMDFQD